MRIINNHLNLFDYILFIWWASWEDNFFLNVSFKTFHFLKLCKVISEIMSNFCQLTYILPNNCLNELMCVSSNCKTLSQLWHFSRRWTTWDDWCKSVTNSANIIRNRKWHTFTVRFFFHHTVVIIYLRPEFKYPAIIDFGFFLKYYARADDLTNSNSGINHGFILRSQKKRKLDLNSLILTIMIRCSFFSFLFFYYC